MWLTNLDPADARKSPELKRRIAAVAVERAKSPAATTRSYPHHHLFRQLGFESDTPFVAIPEVSSENRRYLPVAIEQPGTIISNKIYGAADTSGLVFAIASSSMFITWMKTVGGRLESRLSFSSTITWNNFPLPAVSEDAKQRIIKAGQKVLDARALYPERSLKDHYDGLVMAPELVKAHDALDREVDKAMGAPRKLTNERQRQELLFANYAKLTND